MAKYLVETFYTCTFKVSHYLDKIDEKELEYHERQVYDAKSRLNDDSSANYTVGGDSARGITFTTAPTSGRIVKIQHKTGQIWYDQGTDPASATNSKGMQNATSVPAKFLLDGESRLPK